MTIKILGGKRQGRYNPDLANQLNAEFEREKAKGKRLREAEPEEVGKSILGSKMDYILREFEVFRNLDFETWEAVEPLEDIRLTTKSIQDFVFYQLKKYQNFEMKNGSKYELEERSGAFITYLMNCCCARTHEFELTPLNKQGIALNKMGNDWGAKSEREGWGNTLKLVGTVGDSLGYQAKQSRFYVHGNVGNRIGEEATGCSFYIDGFMKPSSVVPDCMGEGNSIYKKAKSRWRRVYPKLDKIIKGWKP